VLRTAAVATAGQRVWPDFLVIGTKRGGTTSLWNWLLNHPDVAPMVPRAQQIKSPHYFDVHWNRGPAWYRSHFPTAARLDATARRSGVRPLCGEASPYYMFHPAAAQRVAVTVPSVKLLVLLREPVARAYSNYWERRGSGREPLPTFEAAIAAEPARLDGERERLLRDPGYYSAHHDDHSYLARGRYVEHLADWLDLFPRQQLLIMPSEHLYRDPAEAFRQVTGFLGLPDRPLVRMDHHNRLPVPPLDPATRERLLEYYAPWNARLAERLGWTDPWA
jgi:hypothetical protein